MKICRPVHVFTFARLRDATTAPVVGEIVRVPSALDTEDTAPPPPPTQTPFTAKQPLVRLKPTFEEEVAVAPMMSKLRTVVVPSAVMRKMVPVDEPMANAS